MGFRKLLSIVALAALTACNFDAGTQYTPPVLATPTPAAASVRHTTSRGYVYVTDLKQKELIVYPAHTDNPTPIRTVPFPTGPIGVAANPTTGNVYASFPAENTVRVFASGGAPLLQTMNAANGLYYPTGMTFDAQGNLWVANRGEPGYIAEYAPGAQTPTQKFNLPPHFQCAGIAFDRSGNLWADVMADQGGFVIEYSIQSHSEIARIALPTNGFHPNLIGTGGNGGLAIDARGFLQVGTLADMFTFEPPSPKRIAFHFYGEGSELRELTAGPNGALYVPIGSVTGHPEVVEIPANSAHTPRHITQGLVDPWGAAEGP